MSAELLLDTGPLVALLDRSEAAHQTCVDVLRSYTRTLVTTEAVVTEATHLLSSLRGGSRAVLGFVESGAVLVAPYTRERLERAARLIDKYADVPMDYADATLVALAEEIGTDLIFTLDRRGFQTYRWGGKRAFRLIRGAR